VAIDVKNDELFVESSVTGAVTVYARTASGNTPPSRRFQGAGGGVRGPTGLAVTPRLSALAAVNQPTFTPGQTLTATIGVLNPGLPGSVDVFVGLFIPDARIVFFIGGGGTALGTALNLATIRPIATGVSLATPLAVTVPSFVSYTWTGNEPRGGYALFFLAVNAGSLLDDVLNPEDIVAFEVTPFFVL